MPDTHYASAGPVHLAYQVTGAGDLDVVLVADWFSNVEVMWDGTSYAHALRRLAAFSRLVVFDKRGVGLSDPVPSDRLPAIEAWMDDVRVVMDDAGSRSAALVAVGAGGPMAMQFAATYPDRVTALVLVNTYARLARAADYPAGLPDRVRDRILAAPYTSEEAIGALAGSEQDPSFARWWVRYQRQSVSPGTADAMRRMLFEVDVRSVLGTIKVPTLVLHRRDDPWIRRAHGRYLADAIVDARLVELPGDEDLFFLGATDDLLDEIQVFLTGARPPSASDRVLATVLFTDLVGSTTLAAAMGDRRWRALLDDHDAVLAGAISRRRGRRIASTGDGVLAVFDGPGRAIMCASDIRDELRGLGLQVRAGLHAGEIELRGEDVGGIAVHIAARVAALAGAGEVLVSSTVRDLVAGSELIFEDRGAHSLKGVPESKQLFAVTA